VSPKRIAHSIATAIGDPHDVALLEVVARGEFATAGFRNREVRDLLYPQARADEADERHRLSAKVSRKLRLLRAHGLIKKVSRTHRYQLTERGRILAAAIHATREANLKQLVREAA
jgi:hypothetical protein